MRRTYKCSRDKIVENLETQGVIDHHSISVRSDDGQRRNTNTHIITFSRPTPPKEIIIGYLNVKVERYIPNPIRCFKCQRFGHTKKLCRCTEVCPKCGESHAVEQCSNPPICVNCGGQHSPFNKECPKWVLEKRAQQIRAERGISSPEARKLAIAAAPTQPAKSSAEAVRTAIAKSPSSINESTQTDLTWPLTASYQVAIPTATTHSSTNTTESLTTVELFVTKQGVFVMYGDKKFYKVV